MESMKNRGIALAALIAVVLALASAPAGADEKPATPATAADDPVSCVPGWHYIKASAVNRWVKPDANGYLRADGNRSADPWNQQIFLCRPLEWPDGWWAFKSNRTGLWVRLNPSGLVDQPRADGTRANESFAVWHVCNFDNKFVLISYLRTSDYWLAATAGGPVMANATQPAQHTLFEIDPPIFNTTPGLKRC